MTFRQDVSRIAVGKKVFTESCHVVFKEGVLELFSENKRDKGSPKAKIDFTNGASDLKVLKYYLPNDENATDDETSEPADEGFLSLKVEPTTSNGLKKFSSSYRLGKDAKKSFVVIDFAFSSQLEELLDKMKPFIQIFLDEAKLTTCEAGKYCASLVQADMKLRRKPNSTEEEISSKEMLQNLMQDEAFSDVFLQATDGIRIPANKCALAARSVVFKKLLLGEYLEGKQTVVPIGFHSNILRAVIEYIHTDTSKLLEKYDLNERETSTTRYHLHESDGEETDKKTEVKNMDISEVATVVSLVGAAMYFQFPGLSRKAREFLSEIMEISPSLSFSILEACSREGPAAPEELMLKAQKIIQANTDSVVTSDLVGTLSASLLEGFMKDDEMRVCEYQRFQMLQMWAESSSTPSTLVERRTIASDMTKHIQLQLISPTFLSTTVTDSGLVSQHQLLEAYKNQALKTEKHGAGYNSPRALPIWKEKQPNTYKNSQVLGIPPIEAGICRWTVQIEDRGGYLWLGIFDSANSKFFGYTAERNGMIKTFVTGEGVKNVRDNLHQLNFATGSKITFVLNLPPNSNESGTLCACVDDGPMEQIFSGLTHAEGVEFVPALCIKEPASVRLLSIETE